MFETRLHKVNEFKVRGFEITLAKHPDYKDKVYVAAVKDNHVLRLFAEPVEVAVEYLRKVHL